MNSYELSRNWFDWCFDNPEKISPNHSAMYFFIIEHCNRLGWKEKFGLPMEMTKDAIGIKNYRTFSNTFNDLVEWGFINVIQKSKNQYSSNIIAIVKNAKADTKANAKALDKAIQKQSQKQVHGIVGIDKPNNLITIEPNNNISKEILYTENNIFSFEKFWKLYAKSSDKQKCLNKFQKLTDKELEKIKINLPNYILSTPDVQYRKNPLTWLNGKCWEDEIKLNQINNRNNGAFTQPLTRTEIQERGITELTERIKQKVRNEIEQSRNNDEGLQQDEQFSTNSFDYEL
jgi:hypothetical protein